ncbi:MAG: alcohol dehydrogenase catalytic domain-containing protein [Gammaproteobacteria bacterium]|nr:alcohol dehydrogenase catalytic domain-containing protein [Gammaproteobacteria bacterium]
MKAVRCCDKHIQVLDVPPPSGAGVRVNVRSAGICSSDLHMIAAGFDMPATIGHEVAGTLSDGRAVALEPIAPCGHCDMCVQGDYHLCRLGPAMVHGVALDGGMAEQMLVPERCIVPLPNNVSAADACLVEPLAVAAHGIRMLDLKPDSRIAIIGAGAVGLAAAAVLTPFINNVDIAARHAAQQEAADRLGAGLHPRGEYDVVVECAGNSKALAQAARLCKPGATILLLATYWEGVTLPAFEVSMKNLRIYASSLYGRQGLVRDVEVAAQLMARRSDLADILITHRLPLDAAPEAFAIAANRKAGAIKVVLEP